MFFLFMFWLHRQANQMFYLLRCAQIIFTKNCDVVAQSIYKLSINKTKQGSWPAIQNMALRPKISFKENLFFHIQFALT